ncbi:MAG: 6-pyruvoyl trahydropterin synthase family protein [Isosphaeraceae bacterium]
MAEKFKIIVEKDSFVFSAGHFITYDGDHCERLHGHNYRASVEISGLLDENQYVFDFIALRDIFAAIIATLDHRMLLPGSSEKILLQTDVKNWLVTYQDRYWSFPKDECIVLPISNTTTELIAKWLGMQLIGEFRSKGLPEPDKIKIICEENFGLQAVWKWYRD